MKYAFCTSFSPWGYKAYGKKFLESFVEHCDLPIFVYHENEEPDLVGPNYRNLFDDEELLCFLKNCLDDGNNYRYQANRFSRKVFAVTDKPEADCWIWIDADIEVFERIDEAFLERVCPQGYKGSYIGRMDWHHSECGWVSYRDHSVLERFRKTYISGEVFALDEWHDSYVFDRIRGDNWFNIAEGVEGMHPWPDTPLGEVMIHHKGPEAKHEMAVARG